MEENFHGEIKTRCEYTCNKPFSQERVKIVNDDRICNYYYVTTAENSVHPIRSNRNQIVNHSVRRRTNDDTRKLKKKSQISSTYRAIVNTLSTGYLMQKSTCATDYPIQKLTAFLHEYACLLVIYQRHVKKHCHSCSTRFSIEEIRSYKCV